MIKEVMHRHPSPLRYPGGKTCIFPFFKDLLKENNLIGTHYAEPYAGGCGLGLKLLFSRLVRRIYINDFDQVIYAIWWSILNEPQALCRWIEEVSIDLPTWQKYKLLIKTPANISTLELAKAGFYLNRCNISGIIKAGPIGGKKQQGKYTLGSRFNKKNLIKKIQHIAKHKQYITLSNLDALDFMKQVTSTTLVYLDPPYYQKGKQLYMNFYTEKDHRNLANFIASFSGQYIISYDHHDTIEELYQAQAKLTYTLPYATSSTQGKEMLIFSKHIDYTSSAKRLKNTTPYINMRTSKIPVKEERGSMNPMFHTVINF